MLKTLLRMRRDRDENTSAKIPASIDENCGGAARRQPKKGGASGSSIRLIGEPLPARAVGSLKSADCKEVLPTGMKK